MNQKSIHSILKLIILLILICSMYYIINIGNLVERDPIEMFKEKMEPGKIFNTKEKYKTY